MSVRKRKAETIGVVVELEPTTHRRLKHVAIDLEITVQKFAREAIEAGIARAERGTAKSAAA